MKKLLFLALVSLGAVGASASDARAWFLHCCHNRCNKCTTTITCKPYNAFSPVCCGNLVCDGCCPINCGGYGPHMPSVFGGYCGGPGGFATGSCDFGSLPAPGIVTTMPNGQMMPSQPIITQPVPQGNAGPQFIVPAPQPINPQAYWQQVQYLQQLQMLQQMQMQTYGGVQPAGYAVPTQVPAYWYGR